MKSIVHLLMLLMASSAIGQGTVWNWEWARSNPHEGYIGSPSQHLCLDPDGNVYNGFWYNFSILLGDSLFSHDSSTYCFAVMKNDLDGNFEQAVEIHGPAWGIRPDITFGVDSYQNLYFAGRFYDSLYIGDSIIRKANNHPASMPDVFVVKLDNEFKMKWVRIISSSGWDNLGSFSIGPDDHVYLATTHSRYNHVSTWANYWDQDSVLVPMNGCTDMLNIDPNGDLVWRKHLISTLNEEITSLEILAGNDKLIYFTGRSFGDVFVDGQLLQIPSAIKPYEGTFFIGMNESGEISRASYFNFRFVLINMVVSSNGDLGLLGLPINPCVLGNDTIQTPSGKIKYLIARVDSTMNPVWFKTIEMVPFSSQNHFWLYSSLYNKYDTIFFATTLNTLFSIDSTIYNPGSYPQGFLGIIAPDGSLIAQYLTESSMGGSIYNMIPGGCGNIYISGIFKNKAVFGSDTLYSTNTGIEGSRYFAKLSRYLPPHFTLGNDTVITTGSLLTLSLPEGYSHHRWSTGETCQRVTLKGSTLGVGTHHIWAEGGEPDCFHSDTITVTVKYSASTPDPNNTSASIYPNPTEGLFNLKTRCKSCWVEIRNHLGVLINPKSTARVAEDQIALDLSAHEPGIYFILLVEPEQSSAFKLIKY